MDFDLNSIIQGALNLNPGSNGANPGVGLAAPAFLAALQQYNNAGEYQKTANAAAADASPVSTTDRRYYIDRLQKSYDDPNSILNDPGHLALVKRGLDAVQATNAAKGYLGGGRMFQDLSQYASDSDATYLDQERKSLRDAGGFQFDPANAAKIKVEGDKNSIDAKNQALATMLAPFLANMSQNRIDNGKNNTDPTNGKIDVSKFNGLSNPKDVAAQIANLVSVTGKSATEIMNYLLNNPDVSPSTASIIKSLGGDGAGGLTNLPSDGSGGLPTIGDPNPFNPNPVGPPEPGLPGFRIDPWQGGGGGMPEVGESVSGDYSGGGPSGSTGTWDAWLNDIFGQ